MDSVLFFDCHIGTRQWRVSSPIIFSLFINDLVSYLKSECDRGIFINDQIEDMIALMFADDVASFNDTVIRLQLLINCIQRFCESVGMLLNLLKTKMIVFRNGGILKQMEKWYYKGKIIDTVPFYEYLGVYFTPKLVWSKTKELLARAKLFVEFFSIRDFLEIFLQTIYSNYLTPLCDRFFAMVRKYGAMNTVTLLRRYIVSFVKNVLVYIKLLRTSLLLVSAGDTPLLSHT